MENIMESIVNDLTKRAEAVAPLVKQADQINARIKSGQFTIDTINKQLMPALNETRHEINKAKDDAMNATKALVNEYIARLEQEDALNPADLTDDCKLFTAGVALTENDLKTILDRNVRNRTMQQVVMRYAREHDIDMGGVIYIGNEQEISRARSIPGAVKLFVDHWLDHANAIEILGKMFPV